MGPLHVLHHILLRGLEITKVALANFHREGRRAGGLGLRLYHRFRWRRRRWGSGCAGSGRGAEEQARSLQQLRLLLRGVMGVGGILGNVWPNLLLKEACQKNEPRIKGKSFHAKVSFSKKKSYLGCIKIIKYF